MSHGNTKIFIYKTEHKAHFVTSIDLEFYKHMSSHLQKISLQIFSEDFPHNKF